VDVQRRKKEVWAKGNIICYGQHTQKIGNKFDVCTSTHMRTLQKKHLCRFLVVEFQALIQQN
jgi:hypothetical protein